MDLILHIDKKMVIVALVVILHFN